MRRPLIVGVLVVLALSVGWLRLRHTAEGKTYFGSAEERVAICRAIATLDAGRQPRLIQRLFADELLDVRCGAVTAYHASACQPALDKQFLAALYDANQPPVLRARIADLFLARMPPPEAVVGWITSQQHTPAFRATFPQQIAQTVKRKLPTLDRSGLRDVLLQALNPQDPAHEAMVEMLRNHVRLFADFRPLFVESLKGPCSERGRHLALAALTHIDGMLRGHSAADWAPETISKAQAGAIHPYEAEWAVEVQPNYSIALYQGKRCLTLGEGAGGYMGWLKGMDGTVDIGRARLSLFAPRAGDYVPWARVYLDDKCGNSFGFWLGGKKYGCFRDGSDVLDQWHWMPLRFDKERPGVYALEAGFHPVRLMAYEDAVHIDQFALVPVGKTPHDLPHTPAMGWDPNLLPGISFAPTYQSQPRGTIQTVVVWVRRNRPDCKEGIVRLEVPHGFALIGEKEARIQFSANSPLARTSFRLHLPTSAIAGEGILKALYHDKSGASWSGQLILGAQFDWATTGPLTAGNEFHRRLIHVKKTGRLKYVKDRWSLYPLKGYDPYRRLDFESAWGPLEGRYVYLTCDIDVAEAGRYQAFLTADDRARVYLDDALVIEQSESGPGEGRLVVRPLELSRGRHRLFVQHYQASGADPRGPEAGRKSANNCNFKLLLRSNRHTPAPSIRGLPHSLRQ